MPSRRTEEPLESFFRCCVNFIEIERGKWADERWETYEDEKE